MEVVDVGEPDPEYTCVVDGCRNPRNAARGWCWKHYRRFLTHGDVSVGRRSDGHLNQDGYRVVKCPGHPNAWKSGFILEHRLVMSEMLGRPLLPGEKPHHKNGVRHDNRPENLELWVTLQPSGQRPEDLLEWADEVIRRYRP